MLKPLCFTLFALMACTAQAADPFAKGDPSKGKALIQESCVSCHASKYGGDGSEIYTREDRIVHNPAELLARIRTCNTMVGTKWFEDEELDVASYLNKNYYKFDK